MRRYAKVLVVLLALVVLFGATGCEQIIGGAVKSGVEKATGVKVNEDDNSVSIEGKDGTKATFGETAELPDGFPDSVPVYEGTITTALETENDKGKSYMVGIETTDAGKDVAAWYETELKDGGWDLKSSLKSDDGGLFGGTKDELQVTIAVGGGADEKTVITLSVGPKSE